MQNIYKILYVINDANTKYLCTVSSTDRFETLSIQFDRRLGVNVIDEISRVAFAVALIAAKNKRISFNFWPTQFRNLPYARMGSCTYTRGCDSATRSYRISTLLFPFRTKFIDYQLTWRFNSGENLFFLSLLPRRQLLSRETNCFRNIRSFSIRKVKTRLRVKTWSTQSVS